MRQDRERRIARGWKPIQLSPVLPPEQRSYYYIDVPTHWLHSRSWQDPTYSNRKFNAGRRQAREAAGARLAQAHHFPDHTPAKWAGTLAIT